MLILLSTVVARSLILTESILFFLFWLNEKNLLCLTHLLIWGSTLCFQYQIQTPRIGADYQSIPSLLTIPHARCFLLGSRDKSRNELFSPLPDFCAQHGGQKNRVQSPFYYGSSYHCWCWSRGKWLVCSSCFCPPLIKKVLIFNIIAFLSKHLHYSFVWLNSTIRAAICAIFFAAHFKHQCSCLFGLAIRRQMCLSRQVSNTFCNVSPFTQILTNFIYCYDMGMVKRGHHLVNPSGVSWCSGAGKNACCLICIYLMPCKNWLSTSNSSVSSRSNCNTDRFGLARRLYAIDRKFFSPRMAFTVLAVLTQVSHTV